MPHPTQTDGSRVLDAARLRRNAVLLLIGVFAGLLLFRSTAIWWRYDEVVRGGQEQAAKFAHLLTEHLQQSFATIDATFAHIVAFNAQAGGPRSSSPDWQKVLDASIVGLKAVDHISVLDHEGVIRHSTLRTLVGEPRGNRPLFRALAETEDSGLIIQGPFRDPLTQNPVLPFARVLTSRAGKFDGVVSALFDPRLLNDFYRDIDLGDGAVISIVAMSGEVLYSYGPAVDLSALGQVVRDLRSDGAARASRATALARAPLVPNGELYLTAARTVNNMPIAVAVSLSERSAMQTLHREINRSIVVLGTVAILFVIGGALMLRELRARTAADAALKHNEARFHEIMYRAPILVSVKDTQGRVKFINKALEDLFGVPWKDAVGKRLKDIHSAMTGPAEIISALDLEVASKKTPIQRELTYQAQSGMRTAMFVKFPLLDERGDVDSIASFSVDLTDQRRAATWFSTIMDHAPAMISLKDINGHFVFVNRTMAESLGRKVSDFLGKSLHEVFPPQSAKWHEEFDKDVIAARAPIQREFVVPTPGDKRTLLFVKFPIFDAKGNIESIGSIATNITEQKKAEKQLAQAQRMEAVGQLTGGIAHDFNNLLTVILGNSELLAEELNGNERLRPLARLTLEAAERSSALTQRLLAFGRRQMLEPKSTDVLQLVEDMESLAKRAAGARALVEIRCADEPLWPAMVDPTQLETAIINLIVNSRDAMPDGGRVVIELANAEIDESYVKLNRDAKPGDYVMVAVSDTGTGMPPEVAARVFEPFFTTKEPGKGTGLGLPTIYGLVKQSGGHIKIYSEVGHGTVVRLYLPRADGPSIVPDAKPDTTEGLPHGTESILLVEDDRIVREHTEGQLVELGYRVTTAASGEEALRLSRHTGKPDLLITDVVLGGGMNGRQLAQKMHARWPGLRVLCVSGYTDGVLPEVIDGRADGLHFLAKPFRRRDLAAKVREALESKERVPSPPCV
jgi:PAS domain S-box-containing protein